MTAVAPVTVPARFACACSGARLCLAHFAALNKSQQTTLRRQLGIRSTGAAGGGR